MRRMSSRAARAVAPEALDPLGQVDGVAAQAPLDQHGREVGGGPALTGGPGLDDHPRQARRQGKVAQPTPEIGDAAVLVERAELRAAAPAPP